MRNLHLLSDLAFAAPIMSPIVACCVDIINERIYVCDMKGMMYAVAYSNNSWNLILLNHITENFCLPFLDLNSALTPDEIAMEPNQIWFSLTFVPEVSKIVGISKGGCIATVSLNERNLSVETTSNSIDITVSSEGVVDGGIAAASWSPDQRLLLLLTNNDTLLCMTNNWEVVNEISFEREVCSHGNCNTVIAWRGDSEYFVIYSIDKKDKVGKLSIFTKDLVFIGVNKDVAGIGLMPGFVFPNIAFAPASGGLIAAGRKHKNKLQVYP